MADTKSATRGRPARKRKDFAAILAGPHYWITVKTSTGRVVRIPVEGKRRKAAGKTKAGKATVRPFKGTQGRNVEYRAKGQGEKPRPTASAVREKFGKQVADAKLKTRFIPYTKDQSAAIAERLKTAKSRVKFHRGSINDASFAASTLAKGSGTPHFVAARQTGFVIEAARPTTGTYVVATKAGMRKVDDAAARSARAAALRAQRAARSAPAPAPARATTASGGPTLREQAAARRASKGTGSEREAAARAELKSMGVDLPSNVGAANYLKRKKAAQRALSRLSPPPTVNTPLVSDADSLLKSGKLYPLDKSLLKSAVERARAGDDSSLRDRLEYIRAKVTRQDVRNKTDADRIDAERLRLARINARTFKTPARIDKEIARLTAKPDSSVYLTDVGQRPAGGASTFNRRAILETARDRLLRAAQLRAKRRAAR